MTKFLLCLGLKTAEYLFIAVSVLTLPLWFPLLALWVILDPPYRIKLWMARNQLSRKPVVARHPLLAEEHLQPSTPMRRQLAEVV